MHILNCQHKGFLEEMKEDIVMVIDALVKQTDE